MSEYKHTTWNHYNHTTKFSAQKFIQQTKIPEPKIPVTGLHPFIIDSTNSDM